MTLTIQCLDIDAVNPDLLATFWADALRWRRTHESNDEIVIEPPEQSLHEGVAPDVVFLRTAQRKTEKNRLHLDLRPDDQLTEVSRLESLGATRVDVGQRDPGWVVMADPEGNEFCVLPPLTRAQQSQVDAIIASRRLPRPARDSRPDR